MTGLDESTLSWLTVEQAAAVAQCSEKAIRRGVASGRLECARINDGRFIRIHRDAIDRWLLGSVPVLAEVRRGAA